MTKASVIGVTSLALAVAAMAGCEDVTDPESNLLGLGGHRVTMAGANQLFPAEQLEQLNLVYLIDPRGYRIALDLSTAVSDQTIDNNELERAYVAFYDARYADPASSRRDRIQDAIMAASEQRCNLYKTYLQRTDSAVNFAGGALATLFTGLGTIFTDASMARALAGAAGITSGTRAEYTQAYLSNLAVNVVSQGIDLQRQAVREEIMDRRADLGDAYTIQAAILDAVRYHGACSALTGFERASASITRVQDPGIREFFAAVQMFNQTKLAMAGDASAKLPPPASDRVTQAGSPLAIAQAIPTPGTLPAARYGSAVAAIEAAYQQFASIVAQKALALGEGGRKVIDDAGFEKIAEQIRAKAREIADKIGLCDSSHALTTRIVTARTNLAAATTAEVAARTAALAQVRAEAETVVNIPLRQVLDYVDLALTPNGALLVGADSKGFPEIAAKMTDALTALSKMNVSCPVSTPS